MVHKLKKKQNSDTQPNIIKRLETSLVLVHLSAVFKANI